ncbi:MAG: hypothetical protein LBL66_03960 [Clostridiales bacterium]|jgi:hypothetical protein|nr:hypothetical protein [Clostridiales bacterium]
MAVKFIIDGINIVDPSGVTVSREDIVSQDRTMNGNLVVDYVATKKSLNVKWDLLSDGEFQKLLNAIESKQSEKTFFTLQYYEPEKGGNAGSTLTDMRAFTAGIGYYPYFTADDKQVWRDVSLDFIEV